MLKLSKLPWIAAGILVVTTVLLAHFSVAQYERVKGLKLDLAEAELSIQALETQIEKHKATTVVQVQKRAASKQRVQAVRTEINKEEQNDPSARPELSDSQLERLRKLAAAANAEIDSARELP